MKLSLYRRLFEINTGLEQAVSALAELRRDPAFRRRELDRYHELAKETRAAINSYITGVLERAETKESGRRFGQRWEREQKEE